MMISMVLWKCIAISQCNGHSRGVSSFNTAGYAGLIEHAVEIELTVLIEFAALIELCCIK